MCVRQAVFGSIQGEWENTENDFVVEYEFHAYDYDAVKYN